MLRSNQGASAIETAVTRTTGTPLIVANSVLVGILLHFVCSLRPANETILVLPRQKSVLLGPLVRASESDLLP